MEQPLRVPNRHHDRERADVLMRKRRRGSVVSGRTRRRARIRRDRVSGGSFRSLRIRNYRLYFIGNVVSSTGSWMQRIGQDWLVLQLTDDAVALGIVTALQFVPMLLFGMWGGVIADRVSRRLLLLVTQAAQLVLALVLGLLVLTGVVQLWMVYALALLLGLVTVVDDPARQAFVTDLVGPEDFVNAQALSASTISAGKLVGPAIAGVTIALVGVATTFLINAASFLAVLVGLVRMDAAELRPRPAVPKRRGQAREGFRYVWGRPELRTTLLLLCAVTLLGEIRIVLPVLARQTFQAGPDVFGYMMTLMGLGALVATLRQAGRTSVTPRALVPATLLYGASAVALAASPVLALCFPVVIAIGVTNQNFYLFVRAALLLSAEPAMYGRVLATYSLTYFGTIPLAGLLMGWLCQTWGARVGLTVMGLAYVLAALAVHRALNRAPHPEPEPEPVP